MHCKCGQLPCVGFHLRQATGPPPLRAGQKATAVRDCCHSGPAARHTCQTSEPRDPRAKLLPRNARVALRADARLHIPTWSQASEKACPWAKPIRETASASSTSLLGRAETRTEKLRGATFYSRPARSKVAVKEKVRPRPALELGSLSLRLTAQKEGERRALRFKRKRRAKQHTGTARLTRPRQLTGTPSHDSVTRSLSDFQTHG